MDAAILKQRLAAEVLNICHELLPGGKVKGHEWCVGGLDGRQGDSLKVVISGPKAGIWAEYGALDWGDIDKGDLLDLWAAVKRISIGDAMAEVRDRYGIQKPITKQATKKKDFKRPEKPKGAKRFADSEAETWLKTERGIYPSTCRAWGLRTADEYKGVSKKDGRAFAIPGPWILFPYLRPDAQGKIELINLKWLHRDRDKDGKKRTAQADQAEYCLWGWHMRPKGCRRAIIIEGEPDAMTVWQCLWELQRNQDYAVFSVPAGAGTGHKHDWIENDWDRLQEFEEFILDFDEDQDGEAATEDVARRLGLHRCRRTRKPHKDVNECLVNHAMTPAEIIALYDNAEAMAPETLKGAKSFVDDVIELFYPTKTTAHGIALPWGKAGGLRLRLGEVSTVTGPSNAGKSALLNQVCLYAMDSGYKSLIASMEMPGRDTLGRASRQACRAYPPQREEIIRFHDWLDGRMWIFNVKGSTKPEILIPDMVYARRRFGVVLFIIDSLMRCGIAMDEYEKQDQFMKDLCAFAEAEMAHVMLVAHMRKRQDPRRSMTKDDIKGSLGITDNAFNNIIVSRNTAKELKMAAIEESTGDDRDTKMADLIIKPDATFTVDKQRNDLGWIGTIPLWYDKRTCLYRDDRDGEAPMLLTFRPAEDAVPEVPDDLEALWQAGDAYLETQAGS
jgi:twinkle protein